MTTAERIQEIKTAHEKGTGTASNIADHIAEKLGDKVSRGMITGYYGRYREALITHKLTGEYNGPNKPRPLVREARMPKSTPKAEDVERAIEEAENVEKVMEVEPLNLTLLERPENACKWPVGRDVAGAVIYCGHEREDGVSYCQFHHQRSLRKNQVMQGEDA